MSVNNVTTAAKVAAYAASRPVFSGLLRELRELSKKKPEATMSAGKVRMVNRVLEDLLEVLKDEPSGKYLEILDDDALPQISDAVLTMVQFESAATLFQNRYHRSPKPGRAAVWVTEESVASLADGDEEDGDEIVEYDFGEDDD